MKESPEVPSDSVLLLTLGEVSDLVSNSHDLGETFGNIVRLIQRRFATDVCSVYTVDGDSGELVLRATVGLHPDAVGRVRMPIHEGLTGLAAERKAPVSVEDAPKHPRFRYFPESGEEAYHSFLGVPLIQGGSVQGVLVVQHRKPHRFPSDQVRLLVGVAAQLAILVTNARLTSELAEAVHRSPEAVGSRRMLQKPAELHGVAACPGSARGRALRFEPFHFEDPVLVARLPGSPEEEKELLRQSLERGREDISRAARHLAQLLGDQFGALMQAQRLMLEDSSVQRDLYDLIDQGKSVEQAVVTVCGEYLRAFQKLDNPLFYERIYDIKDVFRRVLGHVSEGIGPARSDERIVVVAHEVSLLELFSCDLSRVAAIVVERGGAFSHVAILARSLQIPMLTHAVGLLSAVDDGDELFVDAGAGVVSINPDPARRGVLVRLLEKESTPVEYDPSVPPPIRLEATVNLLPEVARTVEHGGEAVGLFRSEFLELACRSFPTEEEQLETYRRMVRMLRGRPLTLRTLDLRADKMFGMTADPRFQVESWDWRLVDQLPHVQDLLRGQIRAALRAADEGPVRILFPMVASERQFACALRLVEDARRTLREEGLAFRADVPIGVMIEVPAAAMLFRHWASRVDFVCVGSNDLLHSILGIDRNDDRLLRLKTPLDPTYLRTVRHVIKHAHRAGKPVTVCGEAASNSRAILALYALGADAVSVPPDDLPRARRVFQQVQLPADRRAVCRRLVSANEVEEVEAILAEAFPSLAADRNGQPASPSVEPTA